MTPQILLVGFYMPVAKGYPGPRTHTRGMYNTDDELNTQYDIALKYLEKFDVTPYIEVIDYSELERLPEIALNLRQRIQQDHDAENGDVYDGPDERFADET